MREYISQVELVQKARCGHSLVVSGRRWSLDGLMMVLCMQLNLGCCTPDWSAIEMNSAVESEVLLEVEAADVTRRWSDPRSSEGRDEVGAASSSRHNTCDLHVNTLQSGSTRRHHGFPSECTTRAVFRTKWLREQPSSVWAHCPPS